MTAGTAIEWTHRPGTKGETWNPIAGCSVLSPGCTNCYAMRRVAPRLATNPATPHYAGTVRWSNGGYVWTGGIGIATDRVFLKPMTWRTPRTIFVNSTSDLFHEGVPDEVIDRIFAIMALTPQHTYQVLTKRAVRLRKYMNGENPLMRLHHQAAEDVSGKVAAFFRPARHNIYSLYLSRPWPLPNVWLGVSAEDQKRADERIPDLLATPAAIRFVSAEPLLGPVNLRRVCIAPDHHTMLDALDGYAIADSIAGSGQECTMLDWVIAGGESGADARPMHPDWARDLRDQCRAAGTPFFFKQWGEYLPDRPMDNFARRGCLMRSDGEMATVEKHAAAINGGTFDFADWQHFSAVGKKAAGRLLDGREWNEMPEAKPR